MLNLAPGAETIDCKRMSDEKLVISTAGSREEAMRIATALVEERLAACVNVVGPIVSIYRWQGKVESGEEFLMLVKTTADSSRAARERMIELHSYELPEAIELNIDGGSEPYLRWILESVGEP